MDRPTGKSESGFAAEFIVPHSVEKELKIPERPAQRSHEVIERQAAFVLAGTIAGIAGMLLAQFFRFAAPDSLYWTTSGQVLIMVVVGGTGTISGPVLGAGLVRLLPTFASSYTDRWQMLMGLVLIVVVLFARGGILGLWESFRARQSS